jgi:predicted GNAT family acetyltransferase
LYINLDRYIKVVCWVSVGCASATWEDPPMSDPSPVTDDVEHHRFRYVEDGMDAALVYRSEGDVLTLVHTEVPEQLGGRGIGGRLVRAAVERAKASGETVRPWCPFARRWLRDHPDEAAGVAVDWSEPPA